MIRKFILIFLSAVLIFLIPLALVNMMPLIIFLTSILIALIVVAIFHRHVWAKPIGVGMCIFVLVVVYLTGSLELPVQSPSISQTHISLLNESRTQGQSDPIKSLLDKKRREFDDDSYFPYQARIEAIRNADTFSLNALEELIRGREIKGSTIESSDQLLNSAIKELDDSLENFKVEKLEETMTLLNETRDKIKATKDPAKIDEITRDFDSQYKNTAQDSISIYENITQVRAALNALLIDRLKGNLHHEHHLVATLDEQNAQIFLDEQIVLTSKESIVREVDLTDLIKSTNYEDLERKLFTSTSNCTQLEEIPSDYWKIPIGRDTKELCIVHRIILPVRFQEWGRRWQVIRFPGLRFSWPTLYDAHIVLALDISEHKGRKAPYTIKLNRNAPIRSINLPLYSFFHADSEASHKSLVNHDSLIVQEAGEPINTNYFLRDPYIWIELLPNSLVFRNSIAQKYKTFLFVENAIAALSVAFIGACFGIGLGPSPNKE